MELKRVVVTGFGAITPHWEIMQKEYWKTFIKGESGAAPYYSFRFHKFQDEVCL